MRKVRHVETLEFIYDSLEEKEEHKLEMEKLGYVDSGQIKKNMSESLHGKSEYVYCGIYTKYLV